MRKIFNFILILIIGGLGGILASQFLLPYLVKTWPFDKINFVYQTRDGTTIINKIEKVTIKENTALEEAIDRISPAVVGVVSKSKPVTNPKTKKISQEIISQGTGFIVTSDGLIITSLSLIREKSDYFILKDEKEFPAEVLKKDLSSGLALLRISQTNLPVVSFAEMENLRLGERVVLVAVDVTLDMERDPSGFALRMTRFVNLAIIKTLTEKNFSISIDKESEKANGSPLINIKGEVIGLIQIDQDGSLKIVPVTQIKELLK